MIEQYLDILHRYISGISVITEAGSLSMSALIALCVVVFGLLVFIATKKRKIVLTTIKGITLLYYMYIYFQ